MLLTNVLDETFIDKLLHSLPSGGKVDFFNRYLAIPFLEKCQCIHLEIGISFFPSSLIRVFMCMQYTYFLGKRYSWVGTLGVSSGLPSGYRMIIMDEHWVERNDRYPILTAKHTGQWIKYESMFSVSHLINAFSISSYRTQVGDTKSSKGSFASSLDIFRAMMGVPQLWPSNVSFSKMPWVGGIIRCLHVSYLASNENLLTRDTGFLNALANLILVAIHVGTV